MLIHLKYEDRRGGVGDLSLSSLMEVHGGVSQGYDPAPPGEANGMMISTWEVPDDRAKGCLEALKGFTNVDVKSERSEDSLNVDVTHGQSSQSDERIQAGKTEIGQQDRSESEEPKAGRGHRIK